MWSARTASGRVCTTNAAVRRHPDRAFVTAIAGGFACFGEDGAPFNKVVGLDFGGLPARRIRTVARPRTFDEGDVDRLYEVVADSGRWIDVVPAQRRRLDHPQRVQRRGSDGLGVYAAINAAIRSFARTWASELRDRKIRVNAVSPGATDTPGIDTVARMLFPGPNAEQEFENYQRSIVPMGRYGTPEEVANAVLFLASDLSSFTTGAYIPVDGGINQI